MLIVFQASFDSADDVASTRKSLHSLVSCVYHFRRRIWFSSTSAVIPFPFRGIACYNISNLIDILNTDGWIKIAFHIDMNSKLENHNTTISNYAITIHKLSLTS